jgi:hypothetical protein
MTTLYSTNFDDNIICQSQSSCIILGLEGDDNITCNSNCTITGGPGKDLFILGEKTPFVQINDFKLGEDKISFSQLFTCNDFSSCIAITSCGPYCIQILTPTTQKVILNQFEGVLHASDFVIDYVIGCNCPTCTVTECKKCQNCKTCDKGGCLACSAWFYTLNGTCVLTCPLGYYQDSINGVCTACGPDCATCDNSKNFCLSCKNTNFSLYRGNCLSSCPNGTIAMGKVCVDCPANCARCGGDLKCITCNSGYQNALGLCLVASCPEGKYFTPSSCVVNKTALTTSTTISAKFSYSKVITQNEFFTVSTSSSTMVNCEKETVSLM